MARGQSYCGNVGGVDRADDLGSAAGGHAAVDRVVAADPAVGLGCLDHSLRCPNLHPFLESAAGISAGDRGADHAAGLETPAGFTAEACAAHIEQGRRHLMSTFMVYGLLTALGLVVVWVTILANLPFFPRLKRGSESTETPSVSVLIPARNEAGVIGATVQSLLGQSYENFELLLLDDNSTDGTALAALEAAEQDKRLGVLEGRPLPKGWLGKNWACHQLAQAASGEYLLFTDADVIWAPDALTALMAEALNEESDLQTVWPTQITESWAERLTVPLISLVVLGYLPILLVHYTPFRIFAAANGQCMLFRRGAYQRSGGHEVVRGEIVEDVALARRVKAGGQRLRMADGSGLIACRMYSNWPEVRDGFAKNILAGHGQNVPFLLASTLFHWSLFLFPWLWLLAGGGIWALILGMAGIGARAVTAWATRQRARDALLMPLSAILMTLIAGRSIWWHLGGRTEWKGRVVSV